MRIGHGEQLVCTAPLAGTLGLAEAPWLRQDVCAQHVDLLVTLWRTLVDPDLTITWAPVEPPPEPSPAAPGGWATTA